MTVIAGYLSSFIFLKKNGSCYSLSLKTLTSRTSTTHSKPVFCFLIKSEIYLNSVEKKWVKVHRNQRVFKIIVKLKWRLLGNACQIMTLTGTESSGLGSVMANHHVCTSQERIPNGLSGAVSAIQRLQDQICKNIFFHNILKYSLKY